MGMAVRHGRQLDCGLPWNQGWAGERAGQRGATNVYVSKPRGDGAARERVQSAKAGGPGQTGVDPADPGPGEEPMLEIHRLWCLRGRNAGEGVPWATSHHAPGRPTWPAGHLRPVPERCLACGLSFCSMNRWSVSDPLHAHLYIRLSFLLWAYVSFTTGRERLRARPGAGSS